MQQVVTPLIHATSLLAITSSAIHSHCSVKISWKFCSSTSNYLSFLWLLICFLQNQFKKLLRTFRVFVQWKKTWKVELKKQRKTFGKQLAWWKLFLWKLALMLSNSPFRFANVSSSCSTKYLRCIIPRPRPFRIAMGMRRDFFLSKNFPQNEITQISAMFVVFAFILLYRSEREGEAS